ncbi:MAG: LuxR family transcriptional regulator [Chryseobacterium sp.]|nr:MAG: LuxR family transcriptional regulator [Chryseobacterium sp.]
MQNLTTILAGKGAEFFTENNQPLVSYNRRQYDLEEAPDYIHNILDNYLIENPDKAEAYEDMAGQSGIKECLVRCMFSNLDGVPDITEDGLLLTEFVACSKRGSCKWEGIGCMKDPFGLSIREQEIAELADLTNEQIAEQLFLSKHTVSTHLQNVQRKLGVKNKKQLIKIRPSIWRQH